MKSFDWYKKIAIVLIIIIISYLLFRVLQIQRQILSIARGGDTTYFKEGMTGLAGSSGSSSDITFMINNDTGPKIQSINPAKYPNLTLKDFIIKSSYNTACIGEKMSFDAITYALTRGYRYLDFEVYLVDGLPCVGYSNNSTNKLKISSNNTLPFGQVLYNIVTEAFSAPTPNTNDPLFINLRMKTTDTILYEIVAKSIDTNIKLRLYEGNVNSLTKLEDIMGKIVLLIDVTSAPDYDSYPDCSSLINSTKQCFNLSSYVNLELGGNSLRKSTYYSLLNQTTNPPNINDDETTDLSVLKLSYPDIVNDNSNPKITTFIKDYGIQFVAVRLNILDTNLKTYETFFANCGNAIVPFSTALSKIN
jgi:hypothetical protein